jgi:DNA polymerase-3 subunit gamma/tau
VTVTTALYRRYRPDSFADVIGQEHVTEPLMTALRKNRVNHAYLFSGPRGCGKTTSARILARCLNCTQGPTDTPCGTCPSCVELARGGSGSLDVIEIDAASHGGVDDARDLRERATYAPVRDRYKIFIIDEAHMVTSAGFNALLKIVEEPPEHIKFIFATTEPDKVIGTIRSRTHHYPFRLVPPEPLMSYLELLCKQENVPVAPGVLSLVIRAGGGSVRDSLSVLDQLMAGAGPGGLDYELAVALLGYTHASLLDDVVEAVAASDAATVFRAVDRVIQTGHDPRRFVEDLLERFRDLIIVQAMPESAQAILRGMPADQIARLQNQAHNLGAAELSRAADVTNTALTEMTGATSPRLQLELLCARILLPSSEQTERGIAARIDRVERRLNYAGNDAGNSPAPLPAPSVPAPSVPATAVPITSPPAAEAPQSQQPQSPQAPQAPQGAEPRQPLTPPRVSTADWPVDEAGAGSSAPAPVVEARPTPAPAPVVAPPKTTPAPVVAPPKTAPSPGPAAPGPTAPAAQTQVPAPATEPAAVAAPSPSPGTPGAAGDVEVLRRAWPEILQTLSKIKRSTWALVEPNAQVGAFDGQVLTLSFTTTGLAGAFGRADHSDNLRQAIHKTVGIDCQITAVAGAANSAASSEPNPKAPASPEVPATSADVAWGLAPAGGSVATAAVAKGEQAEKRVAAPAESLPGRDQRSAPGSGHEKPQPAELGRVERENAAAEAPAAPDSPDTAEVPGPDLGTAGTYAYSDDDWGPPRDEDAPPLDEEPPMDWDPSAPVEPRRTASAAAAGAGAATQAKKPASGTVRTATPAGAPTPPAHAHAPAPAPAPAPEAPKPDTARDPWTRAVEQAPGVWVIGSESNVGKSATTPSPDEAAGPAAPSPAYEPAAAQVPTSAPVKNPEADPGADWGLPAAAIRPVPEPLTPASAPTTEPEASERVREPVYAMASSAPAAAPPRPAPATSPSAAAARQSLYQRLSNSPEAEAGRAKAPARAVAASATYVQDIPSADDETIEESGVFGRAAVERILGGKLIEERSLDGSPLPPGY